MDTDANREVSAAALAVRQAGHPIDRKADPVAFEAAGVWLYLRPFTPVERVALVQWVRANGRQDPERDGAAMYIASVCDERGNRLHELADVEAVMLTVEIDVIAAVVAETARINGFD